jgi:hypothetical protein
MVWRKSRRPPRAAATEGVQAAPSPSRRLRISERP